MKRMMLIINPAAGKSAIRDNLMGIVKTFTEENYIVSIFMTQQKGDAVRFAKEEAKGFDILVCVGGDGTLNEVINGMVQGAVDIPIGYIPAGTTNDFAASHNLSRFPRQAARNILKGKGNLHDIGLFNDRYFAYVSACGIFSDVSFTTPQSLKNAFGRLAYYFEGARKITDLLNQYKFSIHIDNEIYHGNYCFLAVANSFSLGGVLQLDDQNVSLSDGIFEVLTVKSPQNPIELQKIMIAMMDKNYNNDMVRCYHGKKIYIVSDKEVAWTVDGENGGKHRQVTISALNRQLNILY